MEFNFATLLQVGLLIGLLALMFRRGGGCCGGHSHVEEMDKKSDDKPSTPKAGRCH